MKNYILRRLWQLIPILLGITLLSFGMMRIAGSDAVVQKYDNSGLAVSQEVIKAEQERLGLDRPFIVQYASWLGNILTGDMGKSYVSGKDVFSLFMSKLPATLLLTVSSVLLTVVISVPLGIIAAINKNKFIDYLIRFLSFCGNSMPNFFVALVLMYVLAIKLAAFPVIASEVSLTNVFLPTLTLAIAMSAKYLRQVRSAVLEELDADYVQGARARGIPFRLILTKSVLRACLVTLVTLLALSIGSLLGGTAIVESIFMWDGVGKMAVDAINTRDYPVIQAYVVWMAVIYVAVNLAADISYRFLDPRIRPGRNGK